jgi:hypothetical protein
MTPSVRHFALYNLFSLLLLWPSSAASTIPPYRSAFACIQLLLEAESRREYFETVVPKSIPPQLLPYLRKIRAKILTHGFDSLAHEETERIWFIRERLFLVFRTAYIQTLNEYFFLGGDVAPRTSESLRLAGVWHGMVQKDHVPHFLRYLRVLSKEDRAYFVEVLWTRKSRISDWAGNNLLRRYHIFDQLLRGARSYSESEYLAVMDDLSQLPSFYRRLQKSEILAPDEIQTLAKRYREQRKVRKGRSLTRDSER